MLRFAEFLAKAQRVFKEADWVDTELKVPPFEDTHVFLVGEDSDFNEALKEIDRDLKAELKEKVPMPFKDVAVVSLVRKPMDPKREAALHQTVREMYPNEVEASADLVRASGEPVWVMDRLIEVDDSHPAVQEIIESPGDVGFNTVSQWFLMVRYHGVQGMDNRPMAWAFGYRGVGFGGEVGVVSLAVAAPLVNEMCESVRYVAAISHPANYVVRVTPELTPKEKRRVSEGKMYPSDKTPHFIICDHEVIVRLRRDPVTHHASPVPHERRGHWARLAERCRHARLLGKDKVWKRPTFVGERTFRDEKNLYEVLLDFGKRENANS